MEFLNKGDDRVDHNTIGRESIAHKWTIGKNFVSNYLFCPIYYALQGRHGKFCPEVFHFLCPFGPGLRASLRKVSPATISDRDLHRMTLHISMS
jgi:hypothetical protein